MTEKEILEWMAKVRDRRIAWKGWPQERYFIPEAVTIDKHDPDMSAMTGMVYRFGEGSPGEKHTSFVVSNGFQPASGGTCYWAYHSTDQGIDAPMTYGSQIKPQPKQRHKCRCDSFNLFNYGCKCGGV